MNKHSIQSDTRGLARPLVLASLAFVIAAGFSGNAFLPMALLPAGCTPQQGDAGEAEDDVADAVEDFYKALSRGDSDKLKKYCNDDLREEIDKAEEEGRLQSLFDKYQDADLEEVSRIKIKRDEATARAELQIGGEQFKEKLSLELDDDDWLVSEWEGLQEEQSVPFVSGGESQPGDAARINQTTQQFFEAFSMMDFDGMLATMSEDFADRTRVMFEASRESDPEELDARKPVSWKIEKLFSDGDTYKLNASVEFKGNPGSWERLGLSFVKEESGAWKIEEIVSRWFEEEEEPAPPTDSDEAEEPAEEGDEPV